MRALAVDEAGGVLVRQVGSYHSASSS